MHDQLQDLLLPAKASNFGVWLWLVVALLFFICVLSLWYWNKYRNSAYVIAHKKLQKLKILPDEILDNSENSRSIALELASLLCLGFGVKHLSQYQTEHIFEWSEFYNKLNEACYASTKSNMPELLREAEIWLKRVK